jgi:peptidoglycan hydrolase-like protein with peptidoglycan-binding domain
MTIPAPYANTVLADAGSGVFKGVSGSIRLAGTMDMRQFRERNEIAFNDIALIKLADRQTVSIDQQERIRQAQKRLQEAGFVPGDIDGVLGPQTREALRQYQAKHGLPKTGDLDEATRRALKVS